LPGQLGSFTIQARTTVSLLPCFGVWAPHYPHLGSLQAGASSDIQRGRVERAVVEFCSARDDGQVHHVHRPSRLRVGGLVDDVHHVCFHEYLVEPPTPHIVYTSLCLVRQRRSVMGGWTCLQARSALAGLDHVHHVCFRGYLVEPPALHVVCVSLSWCVSDTL
jgi:hypothetical protein